MTLKEEDIQKIADLARLSLSKDELPEYTEKLSAILDYIGKLNELDTENVEVTSQTTGLFNVFRKDEVKKSEIEEDLVECSPLPKENKQIKVKSVF